MEQMDTVRHTDSVLANLMGLNRLASQQQAYGRKIDFLSKGHLQNVALVDSRRGSDFDENEACMEIDGMPEAKDVTEETMTPGVVEHHNMPLSGLHRSANENLNAMNGRSDCLPVDHSHFYGKGFGCDLSKPHFNKEMFGKHLQAPYLLSPQCCSALQRKVVPENETFYQYRHERSSLNLGKNSIEDHGEFDEKHSPDLLLSKLKINADPCPLTTVSIKSTSGKGHHAGRLLSGFHYLSSERMQNASSSAGNKRKCLKVRKRETMDRAVVHYRDNNNSQRGIAEETTSQVRNSVWHSFCRTGSELIMKTANELQKSKPSKPTTVPQTTKSITRRFILHKDWCLDIGENEKHVCHVSSENSMHRNVKAIYTLDAEIDHNVQEIPSTSNGRHNFEDTEGALRVLDSPTYVSACSDIEELDDHDISVALYDRQGELLKQDSCGEDLVAFESPSHTFSTFMDDVEADNLINKDQNTPTDLGYQKSQKTELKADHDASVQETNHEALGLSPLWEGEPEYVLRSPEAHRPSFDSSQIQSPERGNGIHGLKIHTHPLDMDLHEVESEVPRMWGSGIEDDEEGSAYCSPASRESVGAYSTQENQKFSYLGDVLDEAGYLGKKVELGRVLWHSSEYTVNPLVFGTLEKKYGKQTCWERSERRLLFDRINKALLEVLLPYRGTNMWKKTVAKRCALPQDEEVSQDEILTMLISQEKEATKESSEIVFENEKQWLQFEEDIDLIAKETEKLLIDELVEEFVSMHSF